MTEWGSESDPPWPELQLGRVSLLPPPSWSPGVQDAGRAPLVIFLLQFAVNAWRAGRRPASNCSCHPPSGGGKLSREGRGEERGRACRAEPGPHRDPHCLRPAGRAFPGGGWAGSSPGAPRATCAAPGKLQAPRDRSGAAARPFPFPAARRPPPVWSGRTGLRTQKRERPQGEAENLKMRARFEWAHLRLAGGTRACACVLGAGSELEAGCRGRGAYDPRAQQLPFRPALPWSASCPQVAYLGWRPHPGNGDKNCPTCLLRRR